MFKDSKETPLRLENFGAGSTISGNYDAIYLVFASGENSVSVLDLKTMKVIGKPLIVHDVNFLTEMEARSVVSDTVGDHLGWTFTDFDLYPEGLKGIDRKNFKSPGKL